jgi:hypothetical protein
MSRYIARKKGKHSIKRVILEGMSIMSVEMKDRFGVSHGREVNKGI